MERIIIASSFDISVYFTNSKCIVFLVLICLKPKINIMWLKTLKSSDDSSERACLWLSASQRARAHLNFTSCTDRCDRTLQGPA